MGRIDSTVIASVVPDSPAAQKGLVAGVEIVEINGVKADLCEAGGGIALGIDKLDLVLRDGGGEISFWSIDDPPESQTHGSGP